MATVALLSLAQASAWIAAPSLVQVRLRQASFLDATCRRTSSVSAGALLMAVDDSDAPKKGTTGGKSVVLGPGLFDPNIQLGAGDEEDQEVILLARSQFTALFKRIDADSDGKIDRDGLAVLSKELGYSLSLEQMVQVLWNVDSDSDGLVSVEDLFNWYREGNWSKAVTEPVSKAVEDVARDVLSLSKEDLINLFQLQDDDSNGELDQQELSELLLSAGFEMDDARVAQIYTKVAAGGTGIKLDRLKAWFLSGYDMQGVHRKFSEVIVTKSDDDKRRIFVRGFPWNAKEDAVSRYFGKRSGEVESVKMINWSRDGRPSGRSVVTFKDEESVENAIKLHRTKMGSRWLEVYRVNQGDREEVHAVEKSLHGALIGIKGAVVQEMQAESGACIIFETEPEDRMVIKGRDHERAKAWAMAQAIISDNEMQSHKVDQSLHGRLIGAKGTLKKMMELESGAHIVYRTEPEPCCMIYGNQAARERAWQLVSGKIWDLQHSSEEYYPLDKKFHGTLVGKGSVVVRALEERTGARIRFVAGKGAGKSKTTGGQDEAVADQDRGAMVVRGSKKQCKTAWKFAQVLLREMPALLSELRDEDIALGALRSLPLSPEQVWKTAVDEALDTAEAEASQTCVTNPSDGEAEPLMIL